MKWKLVGLLIGVCIGLGVLLSSCSVPEPYRRDVAQANHEDKQGLEAVREAFDEATQTMDVEKLREVERRLQRSIKLTDEALKAFPPKDFTATDDTYDQVFDDMAKLRKQMEELRSMLGMIQGLIGKLGEAGKVVASGGFSLLSPEGGGLSALIAGLITAAITAILQNKGKKKAQAGLAQEKDEHSLTSQLFGLVTEQISQQQERQKGSQDPLLTAIAEKAAKTGLYNELEAKLDKAGQKTTRSSKSNGNGS